MIENEYRAVFSPPSADSKYFWEGCNRSELRLQYCADCQKSFYYARRLCPHCGGSRLEWRCSTGDGKIFSFSEVCTSFFGSAWDDQLPYTVALIDLNEGPRMLSRLILRSGEVPSVGAQVHVVFVEIGTQKLPFFGL